MIRNAEIMMALIEQYKRRLEKEKEIKDWLKNTRGLKEETIEEFKLGWTGKALAIPIYDKDKNYKFFKYRADPRVERSFPKYWNDQGGAAEIFGWEHIIYPKTAVVLCAGELDRLLLETHSIPAVTLTTGEMSFNQEFAELFNNLPSEVLISYDNDSAGKKGVTKILQLVPKAKIIAIPELSGIKDVTDFISAYGVGEYKKLIENARNQKKVPSQDSDDGEPTIVEDMTRINLALAFTDDFALITQPFSTKKKSKKSGEVIADGLWVINSDKEQFYATSEALYERKLYPSGNCFISEARWHYKYVKQWLAGQSKSDPVQLFNSISDLFRKYLDYRDERLYELLPVWIIGTYLFLLFDFYPILFLNGVSGSGKTKTACLVDKMAFNSLNTGNISDASFFRSVQGALSTLICDEAEAIDDPNRVTLMNLLLAGIGKQGKVIRTEQNKDGEFIPTVYEVYSPKIIANIAGGANEALVNRCIAIPMTPTNSEKGKLSIEEEDVTVFEEIRNQLYMFLMEHWLEVRNTIPTVKEYSKDFNGYDWLIWKPMIIIAKYLDQCVPGKSLVSTILSIAKEKTSEKKKRVALGQDTTLLEVIRDMFMQKVELQEVKSNKAEFYATRHIREVLAYRLELRTNSESYDRLSLAKVGRMISRLDIGEMDQIRIEGESKPVRGVWVNINRLNDILLRFEIPSVDEASRPQLKTSIDELIGFPSRDYKVPDNY